MEESLLCIIGAVILLSFSCMAVVFNSTLLIVLYKDPLKCFRSQTTVYITSLATLDFFVGAVGGPFAAESYITCALGSEDTAFIKKRFPAVLQQFLARAEIFLVLAFSVERLSNTAFPMNSRRFGRSKSAIVCVACIMLFSFFYSAFQLVADKDWIHRLDIHLNITIPLIATGIISNALYKSLRQMADQPSALMDPPSNGSVSRCTEEHFNKQRKEKTFATAFLFITLFLFITVFPFFVFSLTEIHCIICSRQKWFFAGMRLSFAFTFLNSAVNPLVYYICLPQLRQALTMVFNKQNHNYRLNSWNQRRKNKKAITVTYI